MSPAPSCPVCRRHAPDARYRPFCSRRCADVDLGRWFSGRYAIAGAPAEDGEDAPARSPADDEAQ
jgi:uncharacterized protein